MKLFSLIVIILASFFAGAVFGVTVFKSNLKDEKISIKIPEKNEEAYWFVLHRKSNVEYLYHGVPGKEDKSKLVKTFKVKAGEPGKKPTPLPELLGRDYWVLIAKMDSSYDPATAPYFLTLDIPITDQPPFGPSDYRECQGQCDWELPGYFGLHGVGGDLSRLSSDDPGSSGCIRHSDEDITYLYNLLDPTKEEIRYYIKDI